MTEAILVASRVKPDDSTLSPITWHSDISSQRNLTLKQAEKAQESSQTSRSRPCIWSKSKGREKRNDVADKNGRGRINHFDLRLTLLILSISLSTRDLHIGMREICSARHTDLSRF